MALFDISIQLLIFILTFILLLGNGYLIYRIKVKHNKSKPVTIIKYLERIIDHNAVTVKDKDKFYFEAKPRSYWKKDKWWQFKIPFTRRWKENKMLKKFPDKVVLARMEMNNGTHREFLVKDDASGFVFRDARYVFDLENRYWVTDSLIWAYDFHESISISIKNSLKPNDALLDYIDQLKKDSAKGIKKQVPINELKEIIEESGVTQVENSINPVVLERVIKSEIIQAILQGSALGRLFRVLLIIVIIIVIIVSIDIVIDFISSDIPSQIGLGGDSG